MTPPTDAELQTLWASCDHPLPQNFARAVLAKWGQPQAVAGGEPVYAFRRKGLDDFCTCDAKRYEELSAKPNLFEVRVFYAAPPPQAVREPQCWCLTCRPMRLDDPYSIRMALCPTCGNKRCPKANDHRNACTNSNEPGQPGSAYPGGITKGGQHGAE